MADESQDEYMKALEAEAAARRKQDVVNTNILNSDDPNMQMAQDVIIGYAAGQVLDAVTIDLLKDSLVRAIKGEKAIQIPFKKTRQVLKLGPKAVRECVEATAARIKSQGVRILKTINQAPKALKEALAAAKASRAAYKKAAQSVATKTSTTLAPKASAKLAVVGAKSTRTAVKAGKGAWAAGKAVRALAGCVAGPVGCAASIALEVAMLAFDVINIVLDILDEKGYQVVIYKADIKAVAESTSKWMNSEYNTQENPAYFDEEIFFDWESFLYDIDENGNIVANEQWAPRYEKLRDEYMASIGITGDWRSRIETVDMSKPDDPGVLGPVTLQMQELAKEMKKKPKPKPKPKSNTTMILIVSIITVVFVVGIIIFMNSSGEDGSEPSTNNGGT
jgi:hypothetical protein